MQPDARKLQVDEKVNSNQHTGKSHSINAIELLASPLAMPIQSFVTIPTKILVRSDAATQGSACKALSIAGSKHAVHELCVVL